MTWKYEWLQKEGSKAAWYRRMDLNGVMLRTCSQLGLRMKRLEIYHATEYGMANECHMHFLVGQNGLRGVSAADFAKIFTRNWSTEFLPYYRMEKTGRWAFGVGQCHVVPYEQAYGLRGVAYCLKREKDEHGRDQDRYDDLSPALKKSLRHRVETMNN